MSSSGTSRFGGLFETGHASCASLLHRKLIHAAESNFFQKLEKKLQSLAGHNHPLSSELFLLPEAAEI